MRKNILHSLSLEIKGSLNNTLLNSLKNCWSQETTHVRSSITRKLIQLTGFLAEMYLINCCIRFGSTFFISIISKASRVDSEYLKTETEHYSVSTSNPMAEFQIGCVQLTLIDSTSVNSSPSPMFNHLWETSQWDESTVGLLLQSTLDISKLKGLFFTSSNYPKCKLICTLGNLDL